MDAESRISISPSHASFVSEDTVMDIDEITRAPASISSVNSDVKDQNMAENIGCSTHDSSQFSVQQENDVKCNGTADTLGDSIDSYRETMTRTENNFNVNICSAGACDKQENEESISSNESVEETVNACVQESGNMFFKADENCDGSHEPEKDLINENIPESNTKRLGKECVQKERTIENGVNDLQRENSKQSYEDISDDEEDFKSSRIQKEERIDLVEQTVKKLTTCDGKPFTT